MKWEWLYLTYVLWGLIAFWIVLLWIFLFSKRDDDAGSDCSAFILFFKHWSFIAINICSILILSSLLFGKYMVLDLLETDGYRLIKEEEGWSKSRDVEVDYKSWQDEIGIMNCCVNHENKLVFVKTELRYDVDCPPETLDEIEFLP